MNLDIPTELLAFFGFIFASKNGAADPKLDFVPYFLLFSVGSQKGLYRIPKSLTLGPCAYTIPCAVLPSEVGWTVMWDQGIDKILKSSK